MLDIPPPIVRAYQSALDHNDVPVEQRPHYVRWLRFYLDFCHKYNHDPEVPGSFGPFEEKLNDKKQEDWKRKQARQAVALYQRMRSDPEDLRSGQPSRRDVEAPVSSRSQRTIPPSSVEVQKVIHAAGYGGVPPIPPYAGLRPYRKHREPVAE